MSTAAGKEISGSGKADEFEGCLPQQVDAVAVMPKTEVASRWELLYRAAGVASSGEDVKRSLRCAVYVYSAINGTSPVGEYTGSIVSGKGHKLMATDLPTKVGRFDVRRFMRGNAAESVRYFHMTGVLQQTEAILSKCQVMEIRPAEAIALCDWLDGALGLTPNECDVQARLKTYALRRAGTARGGRSVDDMQADRKDGALQAEAASTKVLPPGNDW